MTDDAPDLVADATEVLEGGQPELVTQPVAIEQHRPNLRPQHVGAHTIAGTDLPVVPASHELDMLAQLAVTISAAATAPQALRNNVNDAFMVLLTARDVGVGLTTAVREFHVIDGKVTLSPKVKNAMVKQQGHGRTFPHQGPRQMPDGTTKLCPCGSDAGPNDDERATWHGERNDEPGILHTSTFTMAMAAKVRAKESGRNITLAEKSTWQQYPQRMLSWRALGYLLDDVFPEVGTGLYSPDELGAVTDEDGVPVIDVVGSANPVRGTSAPRGHNAPPPPPEPLASDADRQALQARIDVLGQLPAARSALVALWTEPRSDDSPEPKLPKLDMLLAKQVKIADAMVAHIEQRARGGEWGPWPTSDDTAQPADEQPADEQATEPAPPSDPPAADEPAAAEPPADDTALLVQRVIAEVQSLDPEALDDNLERRGLSTTGRLDTRRHRLATAMITEANDDDPQDGAE